MATSTARSMPPKLPAVKARNFTAIPYFAWQNRGASQMKVWLKRTDKN